MYFIFYGENEKAFAELNYKKYVDSVAHKIYFTFAKNKHKNGNRREKRAFIRW